MVPEVPVIPPAASNNMAGFALATAPLYGVGIGFAPVSCSALRLAVAGEARRCRLRSCLGVALVLTMIPGELFVKDGDIELNAKRKTVTLTVANSGDRPIQGRAFC